MYTMGSGDYFGTMIIISEENNITGSKWIIVLTLVISQCMAVDVAKVENNFISSGQSCIIPLMEIDLDITSCLLLTLYMPMHTRLCYYYTLASASFTP